MYVHPSTCFSFVFSAIKTLGEAGIEETTSEWVQKIKALQDEKKKAEKRVIHLIGSEKFYDVMFFILTPTLLSTVS